MVATGGSVTHVDGGWSLRETSHKLIVEMKPNGEYEFELYALPSDPREQRNLANERPKLVDELSRRLLRRLAQLGIFAPAGGRNVAFPRGNCEVYPIWLHCDNAISRTAAALRGIDSETRAQLRALGYSTDSAE